MTARPHKLPPRMLRKIHFDTKSGCWIWKAAISTTGYGVFRYEGKARNAHRLAYELIVGAIEPGLYLDHSCFNKACVNPEHLRAVPPKNNSEHRQGSNSNSKTGIRGVSWHKQSKRWMVTVCHHGQTVYGGTFPDLEGADRAARELRSSLFTMSKEAER